MVELTVEVVVVVVDGMAVAELAAPNVTPEGSGRPSWQSISGLLARKGVQAYSVCCRRSCHAGTVLNAGQVICTLEAV